jgi:hypothetical protein
MRRPRIGLTLGITLLGFSACNNGGGPGAKTDGAVSSGFERTRFKGGWCAEEGKAGAKATAKPGREGNPRG